MKRWLPLGLLLTFILAATAYLFLSKEKSKYIPRTNDPALIYREACLHCHGNKGQGSGLFYPAFENNLNKDEIFNTITNGSLWMPAFSQIRGDTLDKLIEYIHSGSYRK